MSARGTRRFAVTPRAFAAFAALACALALGLAPAARAAKPPAPAPAPPSAPARLPAADDRLPGSNVRERDLPLMFSLPPTAQQTVRWQRPLPPLDPARMQRLRNASMLRQAGQADRARDSLLALDREVPHHGLIVTELALAELASGRDAAAVNRLRSERAACHDSLLGSRDLAMALERTAKPREAAGVAIETWVAAPSEGAWASALLLRLAPTDVRGITDALRAACVRRPQRSDMARGLALLLARQGRAAEAAEALAASERPASRVSLRRMFADEALQTGVRTDSLAAREALLGVAADTSFDALLRMDSARRLLDLDQGSGRTDESAPRLARALADVPPGEWGADVLLEVSRGLRASGRGADAAALIARGSGSVGRNPELALEHALDLARSGDPERAISVLDSLARRWPPARFPLAEAQFWTGRTDSALANYQRASENADAPDALAALERVYLLEERPGSPELRALGAIAWERWRGAKLRARTLADSLWQALPLASPFYAHAALQAHEARAEAGDWTASILPLAAVADSLPGDRLAPLARERAGEAYLHLGDERRALAQFEECLARYPRAWNSPEVRRQVDRLRKERRL